jgi:hypothetical protein
MLPTNNDTGTFFSVSSQIGKFTDFIVACHIFSLFLSISVENRLEHVTSISKSSCTASGIQNFRIWSDTVNTESGFPKQMASQINQL